MLEGDRGVGRRRGQAGRAASRRPRARVLLLAALVAMALVPSALLSGALGQAIGDLERYQRRLERKFRLLDSNGDGRLSPSEVRGRQFLESNFPRLDQGGKGYLVPADMALPPDQRHFLGERLRQAFERADANRDGRLCGFEVAAFPWLLQHVVQADRNGDGCVTLGELWAVRRALAPRPQRDD